MMLLRLVSVFTVMWWSRRSEASHGQAGLLLGSGCSPGQSPRGDDVAATAEGLGLAESGAHLRLGEV
jgi:hypothetical protein